jgi:hypothetical protein
MAAVAELAVLAALKVAIKAVRRPGPFSASSESLT